MTGLVNTQSTEPDRIRVYRHVRRAQRVKDFGKWYETNDFEARGGVTFYFDVNLDSKVIEFSTATCHPEDNFNRNKSNRIAKSRFDNDCGFSGIYDPAVSLVDNAYRIISEYVAEGSVPHGYTESSLLTLGGTLDYCLKRGEYDPNFITEQVTYRVPRKYAHLMRDAINATLASINKHVEQEAEAA